MSAYIDIIKASTGTTVVKEVVLMPSHEAHLIRVQVDEYATARVIIHANALSGTLYITTSLAPRARLFIGVCVTAPESSNLAIHSFQWHEQPHGTSRIWVRKIIADNAVATYQGLIHIAEGAVGTVVSQDDKTLLDGARARAESQPILEVLNSDVSCSHGSALGRVDPQMVWYMQTCGLDVHAARTMLYEAFFAEVYELVLHKG